MRIKISDRFEYDRCFGSRAETDLEVDCGGITILLDPSSAQRADGVSIDFVTGPEGSGFKIENPNEPPRVRQRSAAELKAMIDRGLPRAADPNLRRVSFAIEAVSDASLTFAVDAVFKPVFATRFR